MLLVPDDCRLFITAAGMVVCKNVESASDLEGLGGMVKLVRPLKLVPQENGAVGFQPMFLKEEWANIKEEMIQVELQVMPEVANGYKRACAEVFSGIEVVSSL